MKSVVEIIPENLIKLRKQNNLTQIDLAQKINYSDKAISRWEKGEVSPSVEILEKLALVYDVPIAYFFEEHLDGEQKKINEKKRNLYISIMFSIVLIVWTVAVLGFFIVNNLFHNYYWQVFMWALPVTAYVIKWCFNNYFNRKLSILLSSICCWLTIISIYVQFLSLNLWQIFLFGIPVQLTIILINFLHRVNKPKQKSSKTAEKIEKLFYSRKK